MASFVEQATLKLIDESSGKVRKINSELKKLFATANKMRNMRLGVNTNDLGKASTRVKSLVNDLNKLRRAKASVDVRVNTNQARGQITRILSELRKIPKSITTRYNITQSGQMPRVPTPGLLPQPRQPRVPPVTVNVGPLNSLLNGFINRLGYTIEFAIISGFAKGASNIDIADTRLGLQGLTEQQTSQAQALAASISKEFRAISRGQALGMIAELFPITRGDTAAIEPVARELAQFTELRIAAGEAGDQAIESAFKLAKAGEQMGAFTDAAGNVDTKKVESFFDTINRAFVQIGREATPELVQGLTKSLRTAKFGLDERGIITALLLAEEQGTTAGVGINQLIKQLSGERIQKKQLNRLRELGLVTTTEVETGRVGKERTMEIVVEGAVDDEGLRTNPLKWVMDNIIPAMRREGFDPSRPTDVSRFTGQITSDRTATEALAALIIRADELTQQVDRALATDVSDERQRSILDQSILLALQETQSQFTSVLGEAANSLSGVFIPALNTASSLLQSLASFIAGPTGEGDVGRAAAVGAAGLTVGAGALFAGKKFIDFINPLTGSATALTGSATALDASAAALMRAAAAQGAGGVADAAGDVPGGKNGGFWKGLARTLGVAALTAGAFEAFKAAAESENGRRLREEGGIDKFLAEVKAANSPEMNAERERNNVMRNAVEKLTAELTTINTRVDQQLRDVPRDLFAQSRLTGEEQSIVNALKLGDLEAQASAAAAALASVAQAQPRTNEIMDALRTPPLEPSALDLKPLDMSSIFESGTAALDGSASRFDAVFATGANDLLSAGSQAGSDITSAGQTLGPQGAIFGQQASSNINAAALGQQFGTAAAAAIAAAAANIRVNVNQQSGPNTGPTSTPVE